MLDVAGDWAEVKPDVRPGGWAFQYRNDYYPDLDDTAVVAMAMDRADGRVGRYGEAIARGREWVEGLQSTNGGWGAFDADNTYHYLNNIPFADHGALLDPPTADVAARCVSFLAQLGETNDTPRMKAALDYLRREQMPDGSWFGRWGVNYVYGTWSVLCALNAAGLAPEDPMVARAADWLVTIQNPDGGWGEGCDSYKLDYKGYEPAPSASSQTSWALLGPDGGRPRRRSGRRAGRRLAHHPSRLERRMAGRHLYRRRLPPCVLSPLPRLLEDLPAVGAGAISQSGAGERGPGGLGHVMMMHR